MQGTDLSRIISLYCFLEALDVGFGPWRLALLFLFRLTQLYVSVGALRSCFRPISRETCFVSPVRGIFVCYGSRNADMCR